MNFSREDVLFIAKLSRMKLSDEEISRYQEQISKLLNHFSMLSEVNTDSVVPTYQPFPIENVMGEDIVSPSLTCETVLINSPDCDGESFKVRAVME